MIVCSQIQCNLLKILFIFCLLQMYSWRQESRDVRSLKAVGGSSPAPGGGQLLVYAEANGRHSGQLHPRPAGHPDKDHGTEGSHEEIGR